MCRVELGRIRLCFSWVKTDSFGLIILSCIMLNLVVTLGWVGLGWVGFSSISLIGLAWVCMDLVGLN